MAAPLTFGGEETFSVPPERLFSALTDLDQLTKIVPDLVSSERIDERMLALEFLARRPLLLQLARILGGDWLRGYEETKKQNRREKFRKIVNARRPAFR